jgi:phosphoribosylformimino-5-aminoimidazole carboxamide ribotide isomerase
MPPDSAPFIVFPAIDLRGGQVVRLKEGDPNRQTQYSSDPAGAARRWIEAGTSWLHVVNLDGAFDQPDSANREALQAILAAAAQANVPVQFGGGLRSLQAIEAALQAGVSRAIIGTLAVDQPAVLEEALARWGAERIGVSLDARGGLVQVRGWQAATSTAARSLAQDLHQKGLRWLVFTDIARDGLQTGLNLPSTVELAQASGLNVVASGGVSRLEDVQAARQAGLAGAIVGRALYEGAIEPQALFHLNK